MDYVERIDSLLESLLSRESLDDSEKLCQQCDDGVWALWRCRDCSLGVPMCRGCIRAAHKHDPLHRIERWTGVFYRPAYLWEVGCYILIRHHIGTPLCQYLTAQVEFLENVEKRKDKAEQDLLNQSGHSFISTPVSAPAPTSIPALEKIIDEDRERNTDAIENDESDDKFMQYLQDLLENGRDVDDPSDSMEMEDDVPADEIDDPPVNQYLPKEGPGFPEGATYSSFIGTYLRVVHTNGIHNIAMINCDCRSSDEVAGDLLGARLLPASFHRIRTLFTVQLLDLFRLSNLELKASAYQFYNLIRRITDPMAPAGVVDLYREFRRMSRLWRWMKRLKWGGYACKEKPVDGVNAGELSIFCAACPQAGINLPANWKDDPARYV